MTDYENNRWLWKSIGTLLLSCIPFTTCLTASIVKAKREYNQFQQYSYLGQIDNEQIEFRPGAWGIFAESRPNVLKVTKQDGTQIEYIADNKGKVKKSGLETDKIQFDSYLEKILKVK